MIELSQLTVLIMIEVMLGLAVLCGLLGYFTIARKERIRKAAHHLAERVQNDNPPRSERLKTLLGERYGLTGNELEQTLHNITQAEMQLFQNLINGYMKDDQVHLQQVDVDEENLVLAYQGLKPVQEAAIPTTVSDEGGDEEELQQLRDENKRLSDELRVTMDTMGRMLNEYSSMFSGGADKPLTRPSAESAEEPAGESEAPELAAEPQSDEGRGDLDIPELAATAVAAESESDDPDQLLDNAAEASSTLDEEVSEIIDEVMEIADEMTQHDEDKTEPEIPFADSAESLLDELEQVDIELPESAPSAHNQERAEVESEPESGSLEEEWAKLLEDDAAGKEKPESK